MARSTGGRHRRYTRGRKIRIVGPVFDHDYVQSHVRLFSAAHVEWVGELGGPAKTAALHDASVFVHTYGRTSVEAGAAVFGESLRAGTPMAALTWRTGTGTCAEAALCTQTGVITVAHPDEDDEAAAHLLACAIEKAEDLDHGQVQEIGLRRFDPARHFSAVAGRSC